MKKDEQPTRLTTVARVLSSDILGILAMSATVFSVMPFYRDAKGVLVPGDAIEMANGELAWRQARAVAAEHGNVGAVAFSRTGHPPRPVSLAECGMLAVFGEVDLKAMAG